MSSRRPQLHLILLLLAYYCSTHTAANGGNGITVQCLPDQAASLLQLKHSFHNPNLSSWQQGTDCCHWEGVGCDRASGWVITLDLSDRSLQSTGGLSPALFNLTSLRNLSLSGNDFGLTSLPTFGFERLIELLSLNLSNARLFGQIPIGISHLKNLLTLDLSSNYGMIGLPYNDLYLQDPSFQTLVANLSNLRDLYLDEVHILSGQSIWSVALADSVPLLQNLGLSGCALYGTHIHHSLSQLRFLATIYLEGNGVSGKFPGFFSKLYFLSDLDLSDNNFEGQIPTKIFHLENLRYLDVSSNINLSVQLPDFPPGNNLESLYLEWTNLSGAIPTSFDHLKSLKYLGLSNIGSPKQNTTSVVNLPSLEMLWLSGSGTEKPLLSWIGRVKHLRVLLLEDYNFSGKIPWWIRNCTNLTTLMLRDCGLSGTIPLWIGNLTKLSQLDFSHNSLTGKIPKVLFTLPSLEVLDLSTNELHGSVEDIPDPLSSFLNYIDLSSNNLTGHIPKSFHDLKRLGVLWLDSNQFNGTFDLSIVWKLKTLDALSLSNNMLSVIDVEDGDPFPYLPKISILRLASCNLTKIPGVLRYTNELSTLDLSNNRINGVIPSWIWVNWKDSMHSLKLSNNMFTSLENYPSFIPMYNLVTLDLSSNKLHGNVPIPLTSTLFGGNLLDYSNNSFSSIVPDFGRYLPNTTYLNLSKNKLCGQIPRSICILRSLEILDLSNNNFSGMVPSCLMQGGGYLNVLKLRDNYLQGMPGNIGEGCMLETIDLNNNQIEGEIARSLSNYRSLEVLDIGNNHIIDSFPSWLASMSNLRVLILRSNQLYGSIGGPTENDTSSKHFPNLQIIDLASNNFSGSLNSKWFDRLETMMVNSTGEGYALDPSGRGGFPREYYQEILTFKGIDLTFTKILTTFKMIDFSNNAFDGPIPDSVGKLIALHGLNMSHNAFTGGIPSKLGNLAQLESLDLSRNKLSGVIPRDLTSLTYLAVLNLSCNNLTGMIPEGPQFSSFTNSSFEGNAGLCGRPLSKQCNILGMGTLGSSVSPQDSVGTIVLFVLVGSGFGVGFAMAVVLSVGFQAKRWNCNCFPFHQR